MTEEDQALWTKAGIEFLRHNYDWFGVASIWYFRQVGDIPQSRSDYFFRMVDVAFTPRLVYWSVAELGERTGTATGGVHNDMAAPIRPIGPWTVISDPMASAGEYSVINRGSSARIRIEGYAVVAMLDAAQAATTAIVRVNGRESSERQVAVGDGQTQIELFSTSRESAPRIHTVEVAVIGEEPLLFDGIIVEDDRSYRYLLASGIVLALCGGAYVLLRRASSS